MCNWSNWSQRSSKHALQFTFIAHTSALVAYVFQTHRTAVRLLRSMHSMHGELRHHAYRVSRFSAN
jgi:hypothetical protein